MNERLTDGQRHVLRLAIDWGSVKKGNLPGKRWRNVDQLERRGLLDRRGYGQYYPTERGFIAMCQEAP